MPARIFYKLGYSQFACVIVAASALRIFIRPRPPRRRADERDAFLSQPPIAFKLRLREELIRRRLVRKGLAGFRVIEDVDRSVLAHCSLDVNQPALLDMLPVHGFVVDHAYRAVSGAYPVGEAG